MNRKYSVPDRFIRWPVEGNPWHPLPPDYPKMDPERQWRERMNVMFLQDTPEDLVCAWKFGRSYYLGMPDTRPRFYRRRRKSAPFHYWLIDALGRYAFNMVGAPRGSAKSTILSLEVPLILAITRPGYPILKVLSTDRQVAKHMTAVLAAQMEKNPRILADFGRLKGKPWNAHMLHLTNGANIEAIPVRGAMQGPRPELILPDDPEFDPKLQRITAELVENYALLLTSTLLPMLDTDREILDEDEGGTALFWIGTILSHQCMLYHGMTTLTDERFTCFNRMLFDVEDDGYGNLLWPEKWDWPTLHRLQRKWGMESYNQSLRNRPIKEGSTTLAITPELNEYDVVHEDAAFEHDPLGSESVLRGWVFKGRGPDNQPLIEVLDRPYGKTVASMRRAILYDHAKGAVVTGDFKAFAVVGLENSREFPNTWWVLDVLVGRWPGNQWLDIFWRMVAKWRPHIAGIEAVAAQNTLTQQAREAVPEYVLSAGAVPRIFPITYPRGDDKEERIGRLAWRFDQFRVKIWKSRRTASWRELRAEIDGFTGQPGATRYDDPLDAVAMAQFVLGSRPLPSETVGRITLFDLEAELLAGHTTLPGGVEIASGIGPGALSPETVQKVVARNLGQARETKETVEWF